ncbi:bifunctional adenosylcobinamide kinase/adenosylcobinamide-phosphate guanylyltransferase [Oceanobacillus sp. Castelsardo]|uniref:bifunctional adenosylcobinamide kinase/adenosylcobinamide-phosphate guanylyltransferase n=1 Tax=Oceanobacillus sp. Castelsardo TaxID=1851204 RepID=UPI000837E62F|nr:bifunctional adenosylcobinamide kinase/adenosylcobinamide-phosphate guanylyltransferase [Oceanobacillus sp. Castelsardo]
MHFVTGGAFNGKRAWVKDNYDGAEWLSSYNGDTLPETLEALSSEYIVLEGVELLTEEWSERMDIDEAQVHLRKRLDQWLAWENANANRSVIIIGTDIMKGIVPMHKEERDWRDLTGWFYQDLVKKSKRVDVIWYGINQTIKKGE